MVVASGRRLRPSAGVAELQEHDLIERGVPKDKIIRFPHDADSTLEEAAALARLCSERHFRSVIVVTSNYHARRARYIFAKVFPPGIAVSVAGAHDGDFDPDHWWEKRKSRGVVCARNCGDGGGVPGGWRTPDRRKIREGNWLSPPHWPTDQVDRSGHTILGKNLHCPLHGVSAVICYSF